MGVKAGGAADNQRNCSKVVYFGSKRRVDCSSRAVTQLTDLRYKLQLGLPNSRPRLKLRTMQAEERTENSVINLRCSVNIIFSSVLFQKIGVCDLLKDGLSAGFHWKVRKLGQIYHPADFKHVASFSSKPLLLLHMPLQIILCTILNLNFVRQC